MTKDLEQQIAAIVVEAVKTATAPLRAQIAELELRPSVPGPQGPQGERGEAGTPGGIGPAGEHGLDGVKGLDGAPGVDGRDGLPGRDGLKGDPGINGTNGVDGTLTLEGLEIDQIDERTFRFLRGADAVELGRVTLPAPVYRGVFAQGTAYAKGDAVTYAGSLWIARDGTTAKPGDGATAWQLAVKAGRDGKEGKQGPTGPQGGKGDRGEPGRDR